MEGNKGCSILAGVILGILLGFWIYFWPGYFLVCGPIDELIIPDKIRLAFFIDALKFGVAPGALVGFIGGLTIPFYHPRGHMAKSIGAFSWIPITALAWIMQWSNLEMMSGWRIAITVGVTIFSFASVLGVGQTLDFIEKIRERRE